MGFKPRRPRRVYLPPDRATLLEALRAWDGDVTATAAALGYSRVYLHRLLRAEGVRPADLQRLRGAEPSGKLRTLREARHHFERMYVERVLAKLAGRRREAARALDISVSSLKNKLNY